MKGQFDYNRFETLTGPELGLHYARWIKQNVVDEHFLNYFKSRSNDMDNEHLEVALFLLSKMKHTDAQSEIARYMRHPCMSLRILAINAISQLPTINEAIMAAVVTTLESPIDSQEVRELRETLHRPSNSEARLLADRFLKAR